jgi:hypothetical protein
LLSKCNLHPTTLWDISRVVEGIFHEWKHPGGSGRKNLFGRDDVELLGYWQAHKTGTCINSANFFELEGDGGRTFFLTAAEDACVHMWSAEVGGLYKLSSC